MDCLHGQRTLLTGSRADQWYGGDLCSLTWSRRKRLARHFVTEVITPAMNNVEERWFAEELRACPHDVRVTAHALAGRDISCEAMRAWGFLRLRGYLPEYMSSRTACFLYGACTEGLVIHLESACGVVAAVSQACWSFSL